MARRTAVSADGNTIVGGGYDFGSSAWIWRPKRAFSRSRARRDNAASYVALDVSDNGKIVVGFARSGRNSTPRLHLEKTARATIFP